MWLGAQADKPGGPRPWVHVLLSATLLALVFAGMGMLVLPSGRLEAWGLDPAAIRVTLLPRLAGAEQQVYEEQPYQQAAVPLPLGLDLEAGTPVYGRLDKRGPFPGLVEMAAGRSSEELSYRAAWSAQRLAGADPPFPTKWCAVMINDKYKVIYLKCPKAAGNTLVSYFGLCQLDPRDSCLAFLDVENATEVQHVMNVWQDYFVFGFTRNILSRAISQYRYLTHFMANCPLVSWDDFCRDPFVLGDACLRAGAEGRPCCRQSGEHQYVHVLPQAHCYTTAQNESSVDWLGRVEHFDEDFAALLQLLNSRPGVPQLPPPANLSAVNMAEEAPCTPRRERRLGESIDQGSAIWKLKDGIFNPCDPLDYFRGSHAHCYGDLMSFFAEDVEHLMLTVLDQ